MIYIFLIYVFLVPFEYIQEKFPKGPTGINYGNLMMGIMFIFWMVNRTKKNRPFVLQSPLNIPLIGFLASTYLGMVYTSLLYPTAYSAFDIGSPAVKHFLQFINAYLFCFYAANLIDARKQIRWVMLALALAAPMVFRVFYSQLHSLLVWHYSNDLRISGPFVWIGSNELGAFMLYSAVMLGLYAFVQNKTWQKGLFAIASFCYIYGVLYSYSRATQLGFLVCCAAVAGLRYRWLLIVFVLMAMTTHVWLPPSVTDRWEMTRSDTGELDASAQSRENFWALALDLWKESPIVGIGVGGFRMRNEWHMDTHNVYYRILCEQGLVGFGIFMFIWWRILHMCHELWKRATHPFDRHYGFCLLIATLGLMVVNYFGDRYTHLAMIGHYWVLVGMAARLHANMTGVDPFDDATEGDLQPDIVPAIMRPLPADVGFGLNLVSFRGLHGAGRGKKVRNGVMAVSRALSGLNSRRDALRDSAGQPVKVVRPLHVPSEPPSKIQSSLNIVGGNQRTEGRLDIVSRHPHSPGK